ncbi:NAD(P)H-hydrate dehydratase [Rhodohalobacter sp. SW132]|uniref:NAD(P)H-hydrate dehydratase n=1 Tax=Rhodohalobacter sp. SW132 TaxID=2293433 RepID=UPI000E25E718|nr:NAD(P)H-hydrate dehydratase [Rhodohalobacter sp. SW132]REL24694.1 NAD(P)H-hydrate dehydratase [Rhodohalobacter sp. SW132]
MSLKSPDNRFLRLCTAEQSRQLDHDTIQTFGLNGNLLMEIAGLKASEFIRQTVGNNRHGVYVCGKGNNAGDAFVIARYLADSPKHRITICLISGDQQLSDDAEKNLSLLRKLSDHSSHITFTGNLSSDLLQDADYIVDGMIGTGLKSELREPLHSAVKSINSSDTLTFSLDIPTGLNCNTGQILGESVQADHTITFGTNKIGFYLGSGPERCGNIHFAELPFPEHHRNHSAVLIHSNIKPELQTGPLPASHKYEKGTVHIIAGSEGMTGAAIMSARSAWKAGAGAVILYCPKGLLHIYEQTLPEIIKVPLGSEHHMFFKPEHVPAVKNRISEKPGPVLAGPGIGRSEETREFILELTNSFKHPLILDADALAGWDELKNYDTSGWILTPHIGELKNSMNISFSSDEERLSQLKKLSKESRCTILSKGYPLITATPDDGVFITGYDTRIFSRAGFGDVLAGTIAGYLAIENNTTDAIIKSLVENFEIANCVKDPEPRTIYGR